MKTFAEFIPLLLFLIVYRPPPREIGIAGYAVGVGGIVSATVVLLAVSVVVYGLLAWRQRRLDPGQWTTLLLGLVFGTLTLVFRDEAFLKWKALSR
ncbi:MAG: septation protein IspZ [Solimonas sp.]